MMGIASKMMSVFTNPKKAFEAIAEKPDWLAPLLVSVLIGILFTLTVVPSVVMPYQMEKAMDQMRDRNLSEEQMEQAMKFMSGPFSMIVGIVGVLLGTPATLLVLSGVFFGLFALLGGKARFLVVFSGVAYAGLVNSLGSIVKGILMYTQRSMFAGTSLALVLSEDMRETFLYRLLMHFDLFVLWQVAVLIIGLGVIYKWKASKSASLVLALWALWALLTSLIGGVLHFAST